MADSITYTIIVGASTAFRETEHVGRCLALVENSVDWNDDETFDDL